jgi:signal transduction histidine kinase
VTLSAETKSGHSTSRPGKIITAGVYLLYLAVVIRTLANPFIRERLPVYLVGEFLFLVLFTLTLVHPIQKSFWKHIYFVCQSLIVLMLVWLRPKFDFIVVLFIPLSFQAVLLFAGRARWVWVALLTLLTGLPLLLALGPLQGLALALMPMTICIVFPAYVSVTQEIEEGVQRNEALLSDLREANRQLTESAAQAEELSAIQERNRLARELHDSVSQTMFSISLHTRAAQILLDRAPGRVRPQLEQLKRLTHSALDEMRSLIAELRPPEAGPAVRTTPPDSSQ